MGVPAGRQLDGAAGREAGTDERVESGLTTFLTVLLSRPRSSATQAVNLCFGCTCSRLREARLTIVFPN
jgi:hypothetical protein